MTKDDIAKLTEIHRVLREAYEHYFARESHCKSSEGHVSVSFGNYWDRDGDDTPIIMGVDIYSYALGPNRNHHFHSLDAALRAVRTWHGEEMFAEADDDEPAVLSPEETQP